MEHNDVSASLPIECKKPAKLLSLLIKLTLIVTCGLTMLTLSILILVRAKNIYAAPPVRPLKESIISATHSSSTTHQMRVFGNGQITDRFLTDNGRNQIDQFGDNPDATTIAVLFDRHLGTTVDVGSDNDFEAITPISLHDPALIVPFSEDSYVIYRSRTLSYQITQQTLTTDAANGDWLKMRFRIHNTGSDVLREGKFLLMIDIDAAFQDINDLGGHITATTLTYQINPQVDTWYTMGVTLLEGDFGSYDIDGTTYPATDTEKLDQMQTLVSSVNDGPNDVTWVVVNIPDLDPDEETTISFGLCAETGNSLNDALDNLIDCILDVRAVKEVPVLNIMNDGSDQVFVGKSTSFTFTVNLAEISDQVPLENISVIDNIAGPGTYVSGDNNGNNKLDPTESWIFTALYEVKKDDEDPLTHEATVTGTAPNGTIASATAVHDADIEFQPALDVKITGPDYISQGQLVTFTIAVTNDDSLGDGSAVNNIAIIINGNDDHSCEGPISSLIGGETWNCTFSQTINNPNTFIITVIAEGQDRDGHILSDTDRYVPGAAKFYLPIIFKNYAPTFCTPHSLPNHTLHRKSTFTIMPITDFANRYVVEVDARAVDSFEYGLIFGYGEPEFYRFTLKLGSQQYRLKRNSNLSTSTCVNKPDPCWENNSTISPNGFNHLKVECNLNTIKLFLGDNQSEPVWQRSGLDCSGGTGFYLQSTNSNGRAFFNNFQLSCPFGESSFSNDQSNGLPAPIIISADSGLDE